MIINKKKHGIVQQWIEVGWVLIGVFASFVKLNAASLPMPVWPTPNTAFFEGRPLSDFIQPTATGLVESGCFGCVRNNGKKFHEGIDLKPIQRDKKGRSKDPIFAVFDGKVAYISKVGGNSSYGQYVVLEHTGLSPCIYTLYAHLNSVQESLKVGDLVKAGDTIGIMGNTSTLKVPKERSHLHFELGLRFSNNFQAWYGKQKNPSPNSHGNWNGMNLVGIDGLDFFQAAKRGELFDLTAYLQKIPTAFVVRLSSAEVPDFVRRYPTLLAGLLPAPGTLRGWEIEFSWYGLPKCWKPLTISPAGTLKNPEIIDIDNSLLTKGACRKMIVIDKKGRAKIGKELRKTLDILFQN